MIRAIGLDLAFVNTTRFSGIAMKRLLRLFGAIALSISAAGVAAVELDDRLSLLEAAAQQGDPKSQTELAVRYEHAEGVPKDFQKANQLYCRAAREGYAEAQFKLGWVYANARGVVRDEGVAAELFRMAAEQGHEYAAKLLSYVRPRPDTQLPSCLLPDPPEPVLAAAEYPVTSTGERSEIERLVLRLAPQYAVDSKLALAVISAESSFNPAAVSPKNAQGLMQLIPETAARFGVKKILNPVENIKGGLAYLRWLLAFFQGDVSLVLAAYNAGERAVEKYRGIPPYSETQNYVKRISSIYKKTSHPYDSDIVEPSPIVIHAKRLKG
jgi:soluble lytic murein transglycosylase-like protein